MPKVEFFGYSSCSSCRNAEALLTRLGVEATKRDLFREPLGVEDLRKLFCLIARSPETMLSRRSRLYGQLGLAHRHLSDDEIVQLMSEYPALVRRPIVIHGERAVVGFDAAAIEALITL